jgi:hypothetical protein
VCIGNWIGVVSDMSEPTNDFSHLWNDLPYEERNRLMPYMMESQILHIWQVKQAAIRAHKQYMKELDDWIKNIENDLNARREKNN